MGIDGIGKPPSPPNIGGGSGVSPATGTGSEFRVDRAASSEPVGSIELGRLGRGEISLSDYLDARVSEATQHLSGKLTPEALEFVKSSLRAELETDPALIELVRRATGAAATAAEK